MNPNIQLEGTFMKHAVFATVSALSFMVATTVFAQVSDPVLSARLDAAIDAAISENRIVGTVVLVSRDGDLIYGRAAGLSDREAGTAMTMDTIFRLTSVSKPVVTAAAMRLVEMGILDLDAPVTDWLPEFTPTFEGETPVIALRQLLSHTSGIGYRAFEEGAGPYTDADVQEGAWGTGITLEENLTRLASVPLNFAPGTAWAYGLGIDVIGRVIEVATNLPLEVAVRDLVTAPLGMEDTTFHVPVWDEDRLSVNYTDGTDGPVAMLDRTELPLGPVAVVFEPPRVTDPDAWPSSGAGMSGTAPDIMALLQTFEGRGDFLSDSSTRIMMTPVIGAQAQSNGPGWGFGIGGAILLDPQVAGSPQPVGTFSWGGAYGHTWFIDPETHTVVVALTNTAWEGIYGKFATDIRDAIYP